MFIGVALWSLHIGFTQGILAAMVAETAPQTLRGSAFGVIAGWLWDVRGASVTFLAGAALAVVPLMMCRFAPRLAKQNR